MDPGLWYRREELKTRLKISFALKIFCEEMQKLL